MFSKPSLVPEKNGSQNETNNKPRLQICNYFLKNKKFFNSHF